MIKIPITSLQKDWDELDKFKPHVISELHRLSTSQDRNKIKISRKKANKLDKLSRLELLEILRKLAKEEHILYLEERNFPKTHLKNPKEEYRKFKADSDFITITPKENEPIYLRLFSDFNNWHTAYLLKKSSGLDKLSKLNLEKVYALVLDMDEKLQTNPSTTITIGVESINIWKFKLLKSNILVNGRREREFREDALNYLKTIDVIYRYGINIPSSEITMEINISKFNELKAGIAKIYEKSQQGEEKTTANVPKKLPENKKENNADTEIIYEIKMTYNNEVLLNNIMLSKVNFDSENANIIEYLLENPNRKITKKELKDKTQCNIGKSLHKIVENLGFTGSLRKVFFKVSEQTILFRNPIVKEDLEKLGLPFIKLKRSAIE